MARPPIPAAARELSLTGNFIDAATAERWGLVNRMVAPEALLSTAVALARDAATCDPEVLVAYKRLINDGARLPLGEALALEQERGAPINARRGRDDIANRRDQLVERGCRQSSHDGRSA